MPYANYEDRLRASILYHYKNRNYTLMMMKIYGRTMAGRLSKLKYRHTEKGKETRKRYLLRKKYLIHLKQENKNTSLVDILY